MKIQGGGAGIHMVGIIFPLFEIGLTELQISAKSWRAIAPLPPVPTALLNVWCVRGYVGNSENFVKIWWWFFHLPQLANLRS